jgi:POT family proton-dependent oligopeptide transporter
VSSPAATSSVAASAAPREFLGHPRGLATLFMTEFFERFTYYGMRALLVLFLVAATDGANPGFGIDRETAGAIYGLYTGAVFLGSLPGGWIADRLIGQRSAVFWGGLVIMLGNFILAIPATPPVFYLGLAVITVGVGLLKPNISAIVGSLYEGLPGARRDAGFSIFYMGINLGAFVAPLVAARSARCGTGAAGSSARSLHGVRRHSVQADAAPSWAAASRRAPARWSAGAAGWPSRSVAPWPRRSRPRCS